MYGIDIKGNIGKDTEREIGECPCWDMVTFASGRGYNLGRTFCP
jgi:hypothetical protein